MSITENTFKGALQSVTNEIIEEERDNLKALVKASLDSYVKGCAEASSWSNPIKDLVAKATEGLKEDFAQLVKDVANNEREALVEAVRVGLRASVSMLNQAMFEEFMKNMSCEWKRNDFFNRIFGKVED